MSSSDINKITTILLLLKNLPNTLKDTVQSRVNQSSRGLMPPGKAKLSRTEQLTLPVELTPILAARENKSWMWWHSLWTQHWAASLDHRVKWRLGERSVEDEERGKAVLSLGFWLASPSSTYRSLSSLMRSSFFMTTWRGKSSSSLKVFYQREGKTRSITQ